MAINSQFEQDKNVKFRQIELEQNLAKLFVDLTIDTRNLELDTKYKIIGQFNKNHYRNEMEEFNIPFMMGQDLRFLESYRENISALNVLLNDDKDTEINKLISDRGSRSRKINYYTNGNTDLSTASVEN